MDADAMEDAALPVPKIRLLKSDTRCARFFFPKENTVKLLVLTWQMGRMYGVLTA